MFYQKRGVASLDQHAIGGSVHIRLVDVLVAKVATGELRAELRGGELQRGEVFVIWRDCLFNESDQACIACINSAWSMLDH